MTILLTSDEVEDALDMPTTIDAVEEALTLQSGAAVPERVQIKQESPDGEIFVMPGVLDSSETMGLKTVTIYPDNDERALPRSLGTILLHDNATGALEAVLDGTHITNYRTGAIGGVAGRYFAPAAVSKAAVFGASTQGRYQIRALDAELELETISVYSRSEMNRRTVEALQPRTAADLVAASSPRDACANADVVVAATAASEPVFPADAVEPGSLVVGIGSNDRSMRELPGAIMERADRVYVDDYDLCLGVGDVADSIEEGKLTEADVVPFGDHVADCNPTREADATRVVKSVGSIVFDIHVGERVLEQATHSGLGTTIDLQGTSN